MRHKEETMERLKSRTRSILRTFCPCMFYVLIAALVGCPGRIPTAAFSAKPTRGEVPCTIEFTDLSYLGSDQYSELNTCWLWDFGDGWASTMQSPKHIYAEPGEYSVALTVSLYGAYDSAMNQDYIAVTSSASEEPPSVASFRINNGEAESPGRIVALISICAGRPSHYMASESSSFAGAVWLPYTLATEFVLSSGNGSKDIYFKVKNHLGESLVASASILLNESDETRAHQAGDTATYGGVLFVWCPPGTFTMGSPKDEQDRFDNEGPQHLVTLTHGFWIGKYEVTTAQWSSLMGSSTAARKALGHDMPSSFRKADDDYGSYAIRNVSWNDAQDFLTLLNLQSPGNGFCLPTEAQWEYACRCATTTRFYWGDDPAYSDIGNYEWYAPFYDDGRDPSDWSSSHAVGRKRPNSWGLYDMSGNEMEWCQDWYGDYSQNAAVDPGGPSVGTSRVVRGGSWLFSAEGCRSAYRSGIEAGERFSNVGLRVAKDCANPQSGN